MARVPVYGGPQEELRPLRRQRSIEVSPQRLPRQDSHVTPELLTIGARQKARLGEALTEGGKAGMAIAIDIQKRETADTVFRAESALKEDFIAYESEMREKRQGRGAKDLTQDTKLWFDERIVKHGEPLTNPVAREIYNKSVERFKLQGMDSASRWEAAQLERSHDESWEATKSTTISSAVSTGAPEAVASALRDLASQNEYQGNRKGWTPEVINKRQLDDMTMLHENMVKKLALEDPSAAAVYFEANKHQIDGKRHDELGKFAKDVSANAIGDQIADALWKKHGPKVDADPVNLDVLETHARELIKNNPTATKAAISSLRERTTAFDKGVREREAANASIVAEAANAGRTIRDIRSMPEFQRLSGVKQDAMIEHVETSRYRRGQQQRQIADQREQDLAREHNAAYLVYSNPDTLRNMSRNEVMALLPSLGRVHTESLIKQWDGFSKSEARVHEARMDQDDFNHVAQSVGLKPFENKKTEDEKAALGELKFRVEQAIDVEQQKAKRPLARAEKMMIMQREMDNKVLVDEWGRDPTKPLILLTKDELKKAYVMVDGQRVNLSSVPAADREEIIKGRQARKLPVNEQAIAETWMRAKQKKAPRPAPTIAGADPYQVPQ